MDQKQYDEIVANKDKGAKKAAPKAKAAKPDENKDAGAAPKDK